MSMNWHTEWSACQRKRKPYSCLPKPKYLLLWLNWDIKAGKSAASDVLRLSRQDGESRSLRKPRAHVGVNPDNQISDILRDRDYMGNPSKAVKDFEKAIASLEKRRKSRIFSVVHTAGPQHICGPETWKLIENRDQFAGIETLEILIHSPGGHAHRAYRLARYFRAHCKKLNALIPFSAKSAATILCLNADTIFMG